MKKVDHELFEKVKNEVLDHYENNCIANKDVIGLFEAEKTQLKLTRCTAQFIF